MGSDLDIGQNGTVETHQQKLHFILRYPSRELRCPFIEVGTTGCGVSGSALGIAVTVGLRYRAGESSMERSTQSWSINADTSGAADMRRSACLRPFNFLADIAKERDVCGTRYHIVVSCRRLPFHPEFCIFMHHHLMTERMTQVTALPVDVVYR